MSWFLVWSALESDGQSKAGGSVARAEAAALRHAPTYGRSERADLTSLPGHGKFGQGNRNELTAS